MSGDVPVDHECETGVAPTELGGAIVETGPQLAYSDETEAFDYPEPMSRTRVGLIAGGIVTAAALVVGAVLFVGWNRHDAATPIVASSPTQTTSAAPSQLAASAPPAPPPVTITTVIVQSTVAPKSIAPKAPQPPKTLSGPIPDLVPYNDEFLAAIQRNGWTIWDRTMMLRRAHEACGMLRGGESSPLIAQKLLGVEPQLTPQMATQFMGIVSAVYPCF